jgi:hypothetical protein
MASQGSARRQKRGHVLPYQTSAVKRVQLSSSETLALTGPASHRLGCLSVQTALGCSLAKATQSTTRVQQLSRHRSANELVRNISEKLVIRRSFPLSAPMRLPQRSGGGTAKQYGVSTLPGTLLIFNATRRSCDVPVIKVASRSRSFSSSDRGMA